MSHHYEEPDSPEPQEERIQAAESEGLAVAPEPQEEGHIPAGEPEEPQPTTDGVLILKLPGKEPGDVLTEVTAVGDVRHTEVETLIQLGLAKWRAKLGFNG